MTRTTGRTGRRSGDSGTRGAILAAARKRFAGLGYAGATIRGIAADAGVDPALVHHFFGSKERLFAAAMRLPVVPGELIGAALAGHSEPAGDRPAGASAAGTGAAGTVPAGTGQSLGEHLVRVALTAWDVNEIRDVFLGLLRSAATSEQALAMLREFATETILSRLSAAVPSADPAQARYRAALVASQVLGLAMTRYVIGLEPLAGATRDELVAAIGPTLDRYLTGDLTRPGRPGSPR
jgi:AcrR family transcriptional regulator